jgi:uncharacterized membrane protein
MLHPSWNTRYLIRNSVRGTLWVTPLIAVVLAQILGALLQAVDVRLGWQAFGLGMQGAKAMLDAVVTLTLSFIVFTFGSLLVAIQVAGGQYSPRVIATALLRDRVIRRTVGLFVFTFMLSLKALDHTENEVPQMLVLATGCMALATIAAFLYLIDYAARLLRPVTLAQRVGEAGLDVLNSVYPDPYSPGLESDSAAPNLGAPARTVPHTGRSAIVLAVDIKRLVAEARRTDGIIEFAPQMGDFVAVDEPLFFLHGGAKDADDRLLHDCVIVGTERTLEQDPLFALRILVDIGIKALSSAINDPTTAVLAIDQLHRLLRRAGLRNLRTDSILDRDCQPRLFFRIADWDDFVNLACCEIRCYGASSLQVARRLRAMLMNLRETLPSIRHAALSRELGLLDRMIEHAYPLTEDLQLAREPDPQGLGGSTKKSTLLPGPPNA